MSEPPPDSIRTKETHWRTEKIADILGIAYQPDGTFKEFKQPEAIPNKESIPDNWKFYSGTKENYGIYQKRSRQLTKDEQGRPKLEQGGYVLTYNLLQRLECIADDQNMMLGGTEASGFQIPTANGEYVTYTSLFQLIADIAHTQSILTKGINELRIQAIRLISLCTDILKSFGVPTGIKVFNVEVDGKVKKFAVGGLKGKIPTISSQLGVILANLSLVVASNLKITKKG